MQLEMPASPTSAAIDVVMDVRLGEARAELPHGSDAQSETELLSPAAEVRRVVELIQSGEHAAVAGSSAGQTSAAHEPTVQHAPSADAGSADTDSPTSRPNPWEALRTALQPPSFMEQVWYVSPPALAALPSVKQEPEPVTPQTT